MKYKKSLGQHYLSSVSTAKKIVSFLDIQEQDTIVEIGAGRGALTEHIIEYKFKKFIIIELDDKNCEYLQRHYPNAEIVNKDAIKINYRKLIPNSAKLISNLPYNAGTKIFRKTVDAGVFSKMVLMFQKEVADRITASVNTKEYSRLSLLAQKSYNAEKALAVKAGSFTPPPDVQSAVIILDALRKCPFIANKELFALITSTAFNSRRKMLRASLKKIIKTDLLEKILLDKSFDNSKISPTSRPQTLRLKDFVNLTNIITKL